VLPGFISVNVIRPSSGAQREYLSIFRFDSSASLMAWEQSDARCEWLKKYRTVGSQAKPTDGKNGARILVYRTRSLFTDTAAAPQDGHRAGNRDRHVGFADDPNPFLVRILSRWLLTRQ
jgi:hypothetical protein